MRDVGDSCIICLQSSLPIEPPPPVTRTFLLKIFLAWIILSVCTGSRPNKSLMFKSLKFDKSILPEVISFKFGSVLSLYLNFVILTKFLFF